MHSFFLFKYRKHNKNYNYGKHFKLEIINGWTVSERTAFDTIHKYTKFGVHFSIYLQDDAKSQCEKPQLQG